MFNTDNDLIQHALNQWANNIETGNNSFCKNDVHNMLSTCKAGTSDWNKMVKMMKRLRPEQEDLVKRIRDLAEKQ